MKRNVLPSFSVLLPTYDGDDPKHLDIAIESVVEQTIVPNELVVVQDGPVNDDIKNVLQKWEQNTTTEIVFHQLNQNRGLGGALRAGVQQCSYPLVARMDADDVSKSDRFERQLKAFTNCSDIDVLGGYIAEFQNCPDEIDTVRTVPLEHDQIVNRAKFRSPMNHGTVMFDRESVLDAGNYRPVDRMEDYDLWVRLFKTGARFANLPEVLVNVRAGDALYGRRGGLEYAREELRLQRDFHRWGFISFPRALGNSITRAGLRLLPEKIIQAIYTKYARTDASNEKCEQYSDS
jgi:glycosyltransferase involved in cell wall biosynthesis